MKKINNISTLKENFNIQEDCLLFLKNISPDTPNGSYKFGEYYVNVTSYLLSTTNPEKFECHKKYIDVHFMISGSEIIYYGSDINSNLFKEYDDVDDYSLYKSDKYDCVKYKESEFICLYPGEIHMAGFTKDKINTIKKAIIKVPKEESL